MGKLINMMQSNLFGKKKTLENNEEASNASNEIGSTACSLPSVTFTVGSKKERNDITNAAFQDLVVADGADEVKEDDGAQMNGESVAIKRILENYDNENIEEKLYELERCYLFEQNNIIDKYEQEKSEMLAKHAEEKLLAKRAYEHEKDELLKEIERKDKMLYELTTIMKEEYTNKLEKQKEEFKSIMENKHKLYVSIEEKLKTVIDSLTNFFENNEGITETVTEFKRFLDEYETFLKSIASEKTSNESIDSRELKFDNEISLPLCRVERQISDPTSLKTINSLNVKTTTQDNENVNQIRPGVKTVSRTLSDNIRLNNECCRKHSRDCNSSDEAIQHELAQAYRKQKTELLKLFNWEKEQYEKKIEKDKDNFERETRAEYVKRMAVERKAWQETIEDYEREVAILKYERQQMDTNYCVGMDKMKTEFEREKNAIHRRYSESCIQLKKNLEDKLKNAKIVQDLKEAPS